MADEEGGEFAADGEMDPIKKGVKESTGWDLTEKIAHQLHKPFAKLEGVLISLLIDKRGEELEEKGTEMRQEK